MIQLPRHDLHKKLVGRANPMRIQLEITRRCNLDCVHCIQGGCSEIGGEMTAADYERLLPRMSAAGVFSVSLTGGEFLCHPEIHDILDLLLRSDFWLALQTNGTLLDQDTVDFMAKRREKIRAVAVSLYGATAQAHESVTRSPGSFEKTIRAIDMLSEAGFRVEVISLLMTMNQEEAPQIQELCRKRGLFHQFNSIIAPRKDGETSSLECRLPEELLKKLPRPWETFTENFIPHEPDDFAPDKTLDAWCTMARTSGYIDSRGNLLPCSIMDLPAGNVKDRPFDELWRDSAVFNALRKLKIGQFECSRCGHFPTCRPCPGLAFLEHGNMFESPKEICRIIELFLGDKEVIQT